jgi:hypothetical protein
MLFILTCLTFASANYAGQGTAPSIAFEGSAKEFGKVAEGEVLTHVFNFTNEGKGPLHILKLEPSCGCTSVLLSEKTVAPGQIGRIEVTLHTRGLYGRLIKEIGVVSNDPESPRVRLRLQALIVPELAISERSVFFGSIPAGQGATKEIFIEIPPEKDIEILSVKSTNQSVTVKLVPIPNTDNKRLRLVLTQVPEAKVGYHFGSIVLRTTSTINPQLMIPVRGFVKS